MYVPCHTQKLHYVGVTHFNLNSLSVSHKWKGQSNDRQLFSQVISEAKYGRFDWFPSTFLLDRSLYSSILFHLSLFLPPVPQLSSSMPKVSMPVLHLWVIPSHSPTPHHDSKRIQEWNILQVFECLVDPNKDTVPLRILDFILLWFKVSSFLLWVC